MHADDLKRHLTSPSHMLRSSEYSSDHMVTLTSLGLTVRQAKIASGVAFSVWA